MVTKDSAIIEVKLVGSLIGTTPKQKKTARALGLRKVGAKREHSNNAVIKGMIKIVEHLVSVKAI